ncbi:MAG: restriction endonuclease [Coprobacillus sp.]
MIWLLKAPYLMIKGVFKFILFVLKHIFGFLFGWIPDFDERMSGEEFESYVKELLVRNGYKKVQLTKRSGDYGIDILATYKNQTYAIQCKKYSKPVGVAAVQQAYTGCEYYGYDIPVVVTNYRFTAQAIALGESNGVLLWDNQELNRLKRKANAHSLFHRKYHDNSQKAFPYESVIDLLVKEGYASNDLLMKHFHYSQEKAFYILEDLQFYDLVSKEDHLGIRDLYFLNKEDAIAIIHKL